MFNGVLDEIETQLFQDLDTIEITDFYEEIIILDNLLTKQKIYHRKYALHF